MTIGECKLCGIEAELQLSHIVPKFIGKWLKETSATGYLRDYRNINKRAQDIAKEKLLCVACEQLFSGWEKSFAEKIFHPHMRGSQGRLNYGGWMAKFCASITWRSLSYLTANSVDQPNVENYKAEWDSAEVALRQFILGKTENLGVYEQHLIPAGYIASRPTGGSTRINRYLMRSVHCDLLVAKDSRAVYASIPGFIFLGHVVEPNSRKMRSSRISIGEGYLSPREYSVDMRLLNYINFQAEEVARNYERMSKGQREKIENALLEDPERSLKSETFRAFLYDKTMSVKN